MVNENAWENMGKLRTKGRENKLLFNASTKRIFRSGRPQRSEQSDNIVRMRGSHEESAISFLTNSAASRLYIPIRGRGCRIFGGRLLSVFSTKKRAGNRVAAVKRNPSITAEFSVQTLQRGENLVFQEFAKLNTITPSKPYQGIG